MISKGKCTKVDFKVINKFVKYKYFFRNPIKILGKTPKIGMGGLQEAHVFF